MVKKSAHKFDLWAGFLSLSFAQLFCTFVFTLLLPMLFRVILFFIFWFSFTTHSLASSYEIAPTEPFDAYWSSNYYERHYCLYTYDVLSPSEDIYTCKMEKVIPILKAQPYQYNPDGYAYDPIASGRSACWQYAFGGAYYGVGTRDFNGIVLKSKVEHSLSTSNVHSEPCIKKSEVQDPSLTCDINIQSIINGAFSNKFPLDLFSGFAETPAVVACPSFTVSNQTFSLCYINKLFSMLKSVLLVIFVITSVMAL